MSFVCPEHGREKAHKMTFNKDTENEYEAWFFSCGRFIKGWIKDRSYREAQGFLQATTEYLHELKIREVQKEKRELYRRFGLTYVEV